ncbi:MAG: PEP-CTERM sorting domain-containing protein, partial [Thermoguttaceae bacterium]
SIDSPNATYPTAAAEGRGVGTLNLMGGSLTASSITLGTGSSRAQGIVNLSGGILTVDTVSKGIGSGTFHWTAGTLHVNDFGFSLQQDGGVLAPGNSIGTTAIDGDYRQAAAGSLEIEIANQGLGGVDYDLVTVNGDVDLDGQLLVRFLDGFLPAAGSVFDVLTATGTIDATGLVLAGDEPDAEPWVLTVAPGLAGSSILRLSTAVAVPEPSSVFLAALGLLALAPWRRRGTAKLS